MGGGGGDGWGRRKEREEEEKEAFQRVKGKIFVGKENREELEKLFRRPALAIESEEEEGGKGSVFRRATGKERASAFLSHSFLPLSSSSFRLFSFGRRRRRNGEDRRGGASPDSTRAIVLLLVG